MKKGDPLSLLLFNSALQKVIQSTKMVPGGIKIGTDKLNVSAYTDDIVLTRKTEIEIRQLFAEIEKTARKLGLHINQEKTKHVMVERKNSSKRNQMGHLKIKNYQFGRAENFKYLGVTINEDNKHQIDLKERIKTANKTHHATEIF